jgi:hypothetical protein
MYVVVIPTGEEVVVLVLLPLDVDEHVKFEVQLNPAEQGGANALGVV